jgi:pyruvate/2-oxoglutarate/acetoin dehydrogenase E1 component
VGLITFREAIRQAIRQAMLEDDTVFVLGQDMRRLGGGFSVLTGLAEEFGPRRVIDTPMSEELIAGAASGAALMGTRPIAEVMFADFITLAMDPIVNYAAKVRYQHAGRIGCPMVLRAPIGAGLHYGLTHQQSFEAWFMHVPGLKVVVPATPYDAKGLMLAAISDPDPVLFFEHKLLYGVEGEVPGESFLVPIGKAEVRCEGEDLSIIAYGVMVGRALEAASHLRAKGVRAEVVDLRSLSPLDKETILESVAKTKRAIVTYEACRTAGAGAEVCALLAEEGFWSLDAPVIRVASPDIPVPFAPVLEASYIPMPGDLVAAAQRLMPQV